MQDSGISWTNDTWNPFVGCSMASLGCANCYAMSIVNRWKSKWPDRIDEGSRIWNGNVFRSSDSAWNSIDRYKGPLIFVCSMSDFFHENASDELRLEALEKISEKKGKLWFQILTKRPQNVNPFLKRHGLDSLGENVWLGVSVENQMWTKRLDILREIPASLKFISFEPLIGPISELQLDGIDWAIIGGESAKPKCRPMQYDWVSSLTNTLIKANIPLFFKQWGHVKNNPIFNENFERCGSFRRTSDYVHRIDNLKTSEGGAEGGCLLDGVKLDFHPIGPWTERLNERRKNG